MTTGTSDRHRRVRTGTRVVTAVVAAVGARRVRRRAAVGFALAVPLVVVLGMLPASANTGTVTVNQDCYTWHARVVLNHDVRPDRSVDVVTTIPGTTGIHGKHYNTTFGQIWAASGPAPATGKVTLNVYLSNGRREFTETRVLHAPVGCVTTTTSRATTTMATTTTEAPTTTTTLGAEGSTVSTSPATVTTSSAAETTTVAAEGETVSPSTGAPSVTTAGETEAAAAANALPRTGGGGGPGPAIGVASLLGGAVMLAVSRARRGRAN